MCTHHSHTFYSLYFPRWKSRFKNDFIVLENSEAESHDGILRLQNFPTFQLNLDPGRAAPYDLNGRIQHDPETVRIVRVVKELTSLLLNDALEPALIHTEMVFRREPTGCGFECEVVRLERKLRRGAYAAGIKERPTQDEAIQDVCSGVCAYSKSKV